MRTTQEVTDYLGQFVIGQQEAKQAIAVAYRERALKLANKGEGWKYVVPNNILMIGPSGSGKAMPLDQPIKIPGGWKRMGDVQRGDMLSMPDGSAAPVSGVYPQGIQNTAKITFADGRHTRACINHLWEVTISGKDSPVTRILTTGQMMQMRKDDKVGNLKLSVRLIDHNDPDPDVTLPLDPYLLGVLLGDGGLTRHDVRLTTPDEHIVEKVGLILSKYNCVLSTNEKRPIEYWVKKMSNGNDKNMVAKILGDMGLMGEASWGKFIPDIYLTASRQQRLELIQGLMDTDGYASETGGMEYSTTSKKLADALIYLIRSLGGICKVTDKIPHYTLNGIRTHGKTAYRLNIRHKRPTELFTLPKKKDRVKDDHQYSENMRLRIIDISDFKKEVCQCIMVHHPDHLYITNEFIVTHNTEIARQLAELTDAPFVKVEIVDFTQVGYYGRDVKSILTDLVNEAVRIAPSIWKDAQSSSGDETATALIKKIFLNDKQELALFLKEDAETLTLEKVLTAFGAGKLGRLKLPASYTLAASLEASQSRTNTAFDEIMNELGNGWMSRGGNSDNMTYSNFISDCVMAWDLKKQEDVDKMQTIFATDVFKKILARSKSGLTKNKVVGAIRDVKPAVLKEWADAMALHFTTTLSSILKMAKPRQTSRDIPDSFITQLVEERGIIFIDEIDKIFVDKSGGNVGNLGVVRDLLPYLDGVTMDVPVKTEREASPFERGGQKKYRINTANILWIASGAFNIAKVSDVPAEILGRLPVHVTLEPLDTAALEGVLNKQHGSVLSRLKLIMEAEGVDFNITPEAVRAMAQLARDCNTRGEDIGARRLTAISSLLFDQLRYDASNMPEGSVITIEPSFIEARHKEIHEMTPMRVARFKTIQPGEEILHLLANKLKDY